MGRKRKWIEGELLEPSPLFYFILLYHYKPRKPAEILGFSGQFVTLMLLWCHYDVTMALLWCYFDWVKK